MGTYEIKLTEDEDEQLWKLADKEGIDPLEYLDRAVHRMTNPVAGLPEVQGGSRKFTIELTSNEVKLLAKKADESGIEMEDVLVEAALTWVRRDKWAIADSVEDVRCIVFEGLPTVFGPGPDSLEKAERLAADKAAKKKKTFTIMNVHKNSTEVALAAVFHGVVIHALEEVMDKENER